MAFFDWKKQAGLFVSLFILMTVAFYLRFDAFWQPHWRGDQAQYVILAMKLDKRGFDGYNLREVRLGNSRKGYFPVGELVFFKMDEPGSEGDYLKIMKSVGQGYYDEPLHMRAPLFSYILMASHRLFAGNSPYYAVFNSAFDEDASKQRSPEVLKVQFWAAIVPVVFNLGVILLCFLLAHYFFGLRVAILSACILITNPVSIMTAYRILSEDTVTFFLTLSSFLFLISLFRKNYPLCFLAGCVGGLAVLTKQTALLIAWPVWATSMLAQPSKEIDAKSFLKKLFNPYFLLFVFSMFLVSAFWFYKVYQQYGSFFYQPQAGWAEANQTDVTGWFRALRERPIPVVFFSIGLIWVCPIFLFALFSLKQSFARAQQAPLENKQSLALVYLWVWILAYYFWLAQPWEIIIANQNQEHRYFYYAYPALAILSAFMFNQCFEALKKRSRWAYSAETIMLLLLILNAWRTLDLGFKIISTNQMLF